jgi:histidine phosphotransferase ChpT
MCANRESHTIVRKRASRPNLDSTGDRDKINLTLRSDPHRGEPMSGTNSALRLIELASARLCHDIGDLVGSLGHASADEPTPREKAAFALTARLELRRTAWVPDGEPVSLARIQSLSRGMPERITVDASALDQATVFPAATGRIVLNLLLLAADSLPSGGIVILAGTPDDLFVRIAGPAAAWPTGMATCLSDETEARSALTEWHSLQMALTALLAHAAGIRLSVLFAPTARNEPPILRLGG